MAVNMLELRRKAIISQPHLMTVHGGNTADSTMVAHFVTQDMLPIKSLKVDIPYKSDGLSSIVVNHTGKNMFDMNSLASSNIVVTDGVAVGRGNMFWEDHKIPPGIFATPGLTNATWALSAYSECDQTTSSTGIQPMSRYNPFANKVVYSYPNNTSSYLRKSQALTSGVVYLAISHYSASYNLWHIKEIQVELGSTATDFEEYKGQAITVDFPATIYGGTVDLISGKLISTHASDGTQLATPTVYSLTPKTIRTLSGGVNNVWCLAGEVAVEYWTH